MKFGSWGHPNEVTFGSWGHPNGVKLQSWKFRIRVTLNLSACADSSSDTKQNCIIGSKVQKSYSYKGKSLKKVTQLQSYKVFVSKLQSYQGTKLPNYPVNK